MPNGLFYFTLWTGLFSVVGVCVEFLLLPCLSEIQLFNTNSVDSTLFANTPLMGRWTKLQADQQLLHVVPNIKVHRDQIDYEAFSIQYLLFL